MPFEDPSYKNPDVTFELVPHTDTDEPIRSTRITGPEAQTFPRGWPLAPKTLAKGLLSFLLTSLLDLLFVLLPVPFLALGIVAAKHDRVPVEHASYGPALLGAAKYVGLTLPTRWIIVLTSIVKGPTLFPIVFAAITGHVMERIASMRLEQGERIGVLEQLLGSMTFFNTFVTDLQLRAHNALATFIMALWALPPIGGQASLRVVTVDSSTVERTTTFRYLSTGNIWMPGKGDSAQQSLATNALFISSLGSPLTHKSIDPWRNMKVPKLELLNSSQTSVNGDWLSVPTNPTYAALIGLPILGVSFAVNSTFNLETDYWSLECPVLELRDKEFNFTPTDLSFRNITKPGWHGFIAPGPSLQFNLAIDAIFA
ncbi:MAG: hypothetical protein M1835_002321, partial [Candelina submexicana]